MSDDRFTDLVTRYGRFLFRIAFTVLRNAADAEDAVGETFLKLYRSRGWEKAADERAYLARAVWRIAVDKRRHPAAVELGEALWPGRDPERAAIDADDGAIVHRMIDALPETLRLPLALSAIDELSSREIAELIGVPEGTVRNRIFRAREMLREKLKSIYAGR